VPLHRISENLCLQQDLSQFWHEKSEELEEELKKRNESLGTFLGMNIKGEKDDEHQ